MTTTNLIRQKLTDALQPKVLEIIDQSAAHAGHAGARQGGGHYYVTIVSDHFDQLSLLKRHQLVYQTLGELMQHEIHALSINALTPSENSTGN